MTKEELLHNFYKKLAVTEGNPSVSVIDQYEIWVFNYNGETYTVKWGSYSNPDMITIKDSKGNDMSNNEELLNIFENAAEEYIVR